MVYVIVFIATIVASIPMSLLSRYHNTARQLVIELMPGKRPATVLYLFLPAWMKYPFILFFLYMSGILAYAFIHYGAMTGGISIIIVLAIWVYYFSIKYPKNLIVKNHFEFILGVLDDKYNQRIKAIGGHEDEEAKAILQIIGAVIHYFHQHTGIDLSEASR